MISCQASGKLARNAVVSGATDKAVAFTLVCSYGENPETKKSYTAYVPCVMFNPSEELMEILTQKGKGLYVEFSDGVPRQTSFEMDGERRYRTEVQVPKGKLKIPFKDQQLGKK